MNTSSDSPRKLYRSRTDTMIAGVCGGLAKYFNADASLIRILFVLFFFAGGSALLVYVIMWAIIPLEPMAPIEKRVED